MSAHEDSPGLLDELARRREERAATGDQPLRERVRDDARRNARRSAAATRHRQRNSGPTPVPPSPPYGGGDSAGAA